LETEISVFEAENATLKLQYLSQVVKIVIGGVPTVLKVRFMCLFMSLGRNQLQGSISMNLFDPMRHHLDLQKVQVGIELVGIIYLMADVIAPGVNFTQLLGRRQSFGICSLDYLLLQVFRSHGIGFGLLLFAGLPQ